MATSFLKFATEMPNSFQKLADSEAERDHSLANTGQSNLRDAMSRLGDSDKPVGTLKHEMDRLGGPKPSGNSQQSMRDALKRL